MEPIKATDRLEPAVLIEQRWGPHVTQTYPKFESAIYDYSLLRYICSFYKGGSSLSRRTLTRAGFYSLVRPVVNGKPHEYSVDVVDGTGAKLLLVSCRKRIPHELLSKFGLDKLQSSEPVPLLDCFTKAIGSTRMISPFYIDGVQVSGYLPDFKIVVDCDSTREDVKNKVTTALGCRYYPLTQENVFDVIGEIVALIGA